MFVKSTGIPKKQTGLNGLVCSSYCIIKPHHQNISWLISLHSDDHDLNGLELNLFHNVFVAHLYGIPHHDQL